MKFEIENGDLFIQVARNEPDRFIMEYQNGTLDEHFSTSEPVTESEVIETFQALHVLRHLGLNSFHGKKWIYKNEKGRDVFP